MQLAVKDCLLQFCNMHVMKRGCSHLLMSNLIKCCGIGGDEIVYIKNFGIAISELLNNMPSAKHLNAIFEPWLIAELFGVSGTSGRANGKGEVLHLVLPIDSYFNNNNGKGDLILNGNYTDIKALKKYSDTNAPIITCENAINDNVIDDLQNHMEKAILELADVFPTIECHIREILSDKAFFMISPYKNFYTENTFIDDGKVKVYTIHEIWHKIYKLKKYLPALEHADFKMILTRFAINSTCNIFTKILPSEESKNDKALMCEIKRWCVKNINDFYDPALSDATLFKAEPKNCFKKVNPKSGRYVLAKEYNTCQAWHEYACIFFKRYLKTVQNILLIYMDEEGKGCAVYIPKNAKNLDIISNHFSLIFPETHNVGKNCPRANLRIMPLL